MLAAALHASARAILQVVGSTPQRVAVSLHSSSAFSAQNASTLVYFSFFPSSLHASIIFTPPGHLWLDLILLMTVGFFVYPVINLIVIAALDIASKKAIGTSAGFIGLFGYVGRTVQAKGFGWTVDEYSKIHGLDAAWTIVLWTILLCAAIATVLLILMWRVRPRA